MKKATVIFYLAIFLPNVQLGGFDYGGYIAYEFIDGECILNLTIVKGKHLVGNNELDLCHSSIFDSVEPIPIPHAAFTSYDLDNFLVRQDTFNSIWDEDILYSVMQPRLDTACFSFVETPCLKYAQYSLNIPCEELTQAEISVYQRGWLSKRFENILFLNQAFPVIGLTFFDVLTEKSVALRNSSPKLSFETAPYFCNSEPQDYLLPISDKDGDSLVFRFCEQYNGDTTTIYTIEHANPPPFYSVPYKSGYSATSPLGENALFEIDAETGNITIDTDSVGWYSVGICVDEYRDGVFLGDHYYLYPIFVGACEHVLPQNEKIITNELEALCYPFELNLEIPCEDSFNYNWFNGQEFLGEGCFTDVTIDHPGSLNIYVEISGVEDCSEIIELDPNLIIDTVPTASFGFILKLDNQIQLHNQSIAADYYLWDFGDGLLDIAENPLHQYANPGTYLVTLTAKNKNECESIVEKEITIETKHTIYTSNAFSPNGDGVHDTWHLISSNFNPTTFKINIYNRWGAVIYTSNNPSFEWQGIDIYNKQIPNDVYPYLIEYTINQEIHTKKGVVVLVN